jgi:cell wall-associated NlpC family hydrolase
VVLEVHQRGDRPFRRRRGVAPPPPTPGEKIVAYARTLLGTPYEINLPGYPRQPGRGLGKRIPPDGGIDCSGYVLQCLNQIGVLTDLDPLMTSVVTLSDRSQEVAAGDTLPGDLVFFQGTYIDGLSHIGIVTEAGGQRFINAREPRVSEDVFSDYWVTHLSHYGRPEGL